MHIILSQRNFQLPITLHKSGKIEDHLFDVLVTL